MQSRSLSRSPLKNRPALSHKNVNIQPGTKVARSQSVTKHGLSKSQHGSPRRTKLDVQQALRNSPVRQVSSTLAGKRGRTRDTHQPKGFTATEFSFYEESEADRASALMQHVSLRKQAVHNENEPELENSNEGKWTRVRAIQDNHRTRSDQQHRVPLQDLDIGVFQGTVQFAGSSEEHRLTLHLNHQQKLPEYVTPPRDRTLRDFFAGAGERSDPRSAPHGAKTTDDVPTNKVVRKLQFSIAEN